MAKKTTGWLFAAAAIVSAGLVIALGPIGQGLKFVTPIWDPAIAVVTALFITTLLVERSMAVINALLFGDEQRAAELQLLGLAAPAPGANPAQAIASVHKWKERLRLLLGFVAGLFVSAAGVRTLQNLLTATNNPWLNGVDVVLTAGLIAGGSNGLAFLLQILKDRATPGETAPAGAPPNANLALAEAAAPVAPANPGVSAAQLRARMVTTS